MAKKVEAGELTEDLMREWQEDYFRAAENYIRARMNTDRWIYVNKMLREQLLYSDARMRIIGETRAKARASQVRQYRLFNEALIKRASLRKTKMAYYEAYAEYTARLTETFIYAPH